MIVRIAEIINEPKQPSLFEKNRNTGASMRGLGIGARQAVVPSPHAVDSRSYNFHLDRMCNRAERGDTQKVLNLFGAKKGARFNEGPLQIHPAQPGTVIRLENGERMLEQMTWGFPLAQKSKKTGKPLKPKPINNARFDKLHTYFWKWAASKPEHRCLIPTARYCEACGEPGCMTETWLSVKDQAIFAWAGLWANSVEWGSVFTGVMTDNAPDLIDIHDRSPVIIDPADWDFWLTAPLEELYRLDRPYPSDRLSVEHTTTPWYQRKPVSVDGPALL